MQALFLQFLANHWKKLALICLLLASVGTSYWYGKTNSRVEIIEKEKIVEKIVEKVVRVKDESTHQKINRTTRIIEHPDGRKETIITENSETDTKSREQENKDTQTDRTKETDKSTKPLPPSKYRVGVIAATSVPNLFNGKDKKLEYTGAVGARVLGPFWADSQYNFSTRTVGVGISYEF